MASSVSMNPSDGFPPRSAALLDTQGFKPGETLMIGRRNRSVDSFSRKWLKTEGWKNQMLFPSDCVSLIQKKKHGCHSRSLKSCGSKLPKLASGVLKKQPGRVGEDGAGWVGKRCQVERWRPFVFDELYPYPELTWLLKKQFEDDFPFPEVG